ncbi:MAG: hypothetical protein AAF327_10590 [Cyanobacteria bacterium P01_A01_bin.37]
MIRERFQQLGLIKTMPHSPTLQGWFIEDMAYQSPGKLLKPRLTGVGNPIG